jgi:hypothetical protein
MSVASTIIDDMNQRPLRPVVAGHPSGIDRLRRVHAGGARRAVGGGLGDPIAALLVAVVHRGGRSTLRGHPASDAAVARRRRASGEAAQDARGRADRRPPQQEHPAGADPGDRAVARPRVRRCDHAPADRAGSSSGSSSTRSPDRSTGPPRHDAVPARHARRPIRARRGSGVAAAPRSTVRTGAWRPMEPAPLVPGRLPLRDPGRRPGGCAPAIPRSPVRGRRSASPHARRC